MNLKKPINTYLQHLLLFGLTMIITVSCSTPKKLAYFQEEVDTIVLPTNGEIKIQPDDKLTIAVKTMDPALSSMFNLSIAANQIGEVLPNYTSSTPNLHTTGLSKYTVSAQGTIDFPVLGELKVAGMTRGELAGFIKGELMGRDLAKNPVVTVEFVNLGVSVMGDVGRPGYYAINEDRPNILEVISKAGDLNLTGRRDNIAVLRTEDGNVKTYRVDLTNTKELAQSPVYYVQQGDVIYVEPNDVRKRQATSNGNNVYSTSFWISVASLLTSVVTTIGVFVK